MKRTLLASAAAIALLVLGALWFATTFEQVETKVWVGPSGQARANPYLAAMRFVERNGMQAILIERGTELDTVPAGATLILLAGRVSLTAERIQTLLRWTQNGGHLVVEPEPVRYRDLLLDTLAIGRKAIPPGKLPETIAVEMPGAGRELQVARGPLVVLDVARVQPEFIASGPAGAWLATLKEGAGRVTVLTGPYRFQNRQVGAHDHAEFLWQILQLAPSSRQVVLLRPPQSLPLWDWLERHALGTIIAGAALIVLWFWRAGTRFGPVRPVTSPARRQLLEHIRACGRFRWASGARADLLTAAREICLRRVVLHQPSVEHLTPQQRNHALAATAGIDTGAIAHAFDATPHTSREFVQIVATLASIHDALGHAGRRRMPPRKRR